MLWRFYCSRLGLRASGDGRCRSLDDRRGHLGVHGLVRGEGDELLGVTLHLVRVYGEAEVVQKKELKLELVELSLRKAANLDRYRKRLDKMLRACR
jgi:hypothetical protein